MPARSHRDRLAARERERVGQHDEGLHALLLHLDEDLPDVTVALDLERYDLDVVSLRGGLCHLEIDGSAPAGRIPERRHARDTGNDLPQELEPPRVQLW